VNPGAIHGVFARIANEKVAPGRRDVVRRAGGHHDVVDLPDSAVDHDERLSEQGRFPAGY
jgi:hypothetical protein